ncbi:pyridine nucleotide-disulfide oxidoreductase [Nocardia farcinica]|nr:pyridine nucleotide-disulfide oxidoreductase [Nocardia farcinica]
MDRSVRVAVVGAGPAGAYAADALLKSPVGPGVSVDIFERLPAPFGLIRYGVAPDHPRIKGIVTALQRVLDRDQVRFFGNVEYGADISLHELRTFYDAVVFATGADRDFPLALPGVELAGSHGAAAFTSWYDGHPDVPREWPLHARKVAILGVGNVALDVARVLAKDVAELMDTEIPPNVVAGLQRNEAQEVHVFGRRGPAEAKFTPLELRELDQSPNVEVIVDPADIDYDETGVRARRESKQVDMVARTLEQWATRDVGARRRKLFLHFFESPVEILGVDGAVAGLRTERTRLDGSGGVRGTGQLHDWECQAVYRAVGYRSSPLTDVPFADESGVIPNDRGRVSGMPATYVTGWIKRGPVGLIGHTKGDANETVAALVADLPNLSPPSAPSPQAVDRFLAERGVRYTTWSGWRNLDAHERRIGAAENRERIKIVGRQDMIRHSISPAMS